MTPGRRRISQLGIIVAALGIWELVVRIGLVDPRLLPPATTVLARAAALLRDPTILHHLWVTASEVLLGFVFVTPLGIGLGLLLGESAYLGDAFKPFFSFMASVPKSVFLPLFILTLGIGFNQKVVFAMFQAIFVLVISSIAAAESVPPDFVTMAKALGATRWQLYGQIYVPAMLPVLIEGVRLGMIFGITGVLFAEMYGSRAGLGRLVADWGASFDMTNLLAGIALAAAMSIVVNEILRWIERRLGEWRV